MSSVMAFEVGALGCKEVMRIEPQDGINVCAHVYMQIPSFERLMRKDYLQFKTTLGDMVVS